MIQLLKIIGEFSENFFKVCWTLLEEDRERVDQEISSLLTFAKSWYERPRKTEEDLRRIHRQSNQQRRAALGSRDADYGKKPVHMEESRRRWL
jgi:hypothetical protein